MIYLHARSISNSSDCLISKGDIRLWQKDLLEKRKKWYYRFYVEDASGKMVQKEYAGTEVKSGGRKKLLRKALEDYENKKFVPQRQMKSYRKRENFWTCGQKKD